MNLPVYNIELPDPPIGNKIWHTSEPGMFVLERGPVSFRGKACTRRGSTSITIYDGVPDESGQFPPSPLDTKAIYNGRVIFNSNPAELGMWMFDGGLHFGLTMMIGNAAFGVTPAVTITWVAPKVQKRQITDVANDKRTAS